MFKPTQNRTTLVSNEILERNRYNLKLNGQKLLFGLAQSIDHTIDLFPTLEVDIRGLWKFLGIEDRNDKYEVVRDALFNITENPLQKKVSKKKWSSIPWMSIEYDEDDTMFVKVKFLDEVRPYLLKMAEYTKLKGAFVAKLGSTYATWLYPIFKMIQTKYYGKHEISIERLKELTFCDNPVDYPAYNTDKSANNKFLTRALGVTIDRETKAIKIHKDSPLHEINEKTDIAVNVIGITKDKQRYKGLIFHVTAKSSVKSIKKDTDKSKYVGEIPKKEVFDIGARFPMKQVFIDAKAAGWTVQEYLDHAGYFQKDNYAYKKLSEKEMNMMLKKREKTKTKRTGQLTIDEALKGVKQKINNHHSEQK